MKKKIHEFRIIPKSFDTIWNKKRTYIIRKNENFKVGDIVKINEVSLIPRLYYYTITEYTERLITGTIIGIYEHPDFIRGDNVILQLDNLHNKFKVKVRKVN